MGGVRILALAGVVTLAAAGVSACGRGSSAPARTQTADEGAGRSGGYAAPRGDEGGDRAYAGRSDAGSSDSGRSDADDARPEAPRDPAPLVDGVPMWSDNRNHTAQENADYHFHRDGPDFGAASVKDYVAKAHQFLEHPPSDIETINRPNGDKLLYDAKSNTFAVERKDGAPRTMFKPRDGASYWKEQQARAASGDDGYGRRRSGSDSGEGG